MNGEQRQLITRSQLPEHIANICAMVQLSCPYSDQGCADQLPRQELHNHLSNSVSMHLDLVSNTTYNATSLLIIITSSYLY